MNSLKQLNDYSQVGIAYEDYRPAVYTLGPVIATNFSQTVYEGNVVPVLVGRDFTYLQSTANLTYTIAANTLPGSTITWATPLPSGANVTQIANSVYRVTGISSVSVWDDIKDPVINMPLDSNVPFVYTATIEFPGNVVTWTGNVTVLDTPEWTTATDTTYDEDTDRVLANVPLIIDSISGNASVVFKPLPSDALRGMSSNIATITYHSGNSSYSLRGNSSTINSVLTGNVVIQPTYGFRNNFVLQYVLTNPNSGLVSTTNQTINIDQVDPIMSNVSLSRSYTQNSLNTVFPTYVPQITSDIDVVRRVELTLGGNVGTIIRSNINAQSSEWNSANLTYFYSGNIAQVNSQMSDIKFIPHRDVNTSTTLILKEYKNNYLQDTYTITYSGLSASNVASRVYAASTAGNTTIVPTFTDIFYCNCEVVVVGGGGTGGLLLTANTTTPFPSDYTVGSDGFLKGGGGGGGGVVYTYDYPLKQNYIIGESNIIYANVGSGGYGPLNPGVNGANTVMSFRGNSITALGGGAGASHGDFGNLTLGQYAPSPSYWGNIGSYSAASGGSGGGGINRPSTQNQGGMSLSGQGSRGGNVWYGISGNVVLWDSGVTNARNGFGAGGGSANTHPIWGNCDLRSSGGGLYSGYTGIGGYPATYFGYPVAPGGSGYNSGYTHAVTSSTYGDYVQGAPTSGPTAVKKPWGAGGDVSGTRGGVHTDQPHRAGQRGVVLVKFTPK